jgi:hypothetical protein
VLGSHMGEWRCRCSLYSQHWLDVSGQLHGACHPALVKRVNWRLGVPHIQSRWFQGRQMSLICPCILELQSVEHWTYYFGSTLTNPYCLPLSLRRYEEERSRSNPLHQMYCRKGYCHGLTGVPHGLSASDVLTGGQGDHSV